MRTESGYVDISITTKIDTSNLVSLLNDDTLLGSWDQKGTVHLYWPVEAWGEEKLKNLNQCLQQIGAIAEGTIIEISPCPAEDWNARWASVVKPVRIGRRIIIRPSWENLMTSPGAIEIILDPKQAFGTGHHSTTQLLIEWLEEVINGKERVLDVGTGSGILAMVALRLGAEYALGIDIDPLAIEYAKDYARMNNFDDHLQLQVQPLETLEHGNFDLILANLDRRTLLSQARHFSRAKSEGTLLLVSGILIEDQKDITETLLDLGWEVLGFRKREDWLAFGFKSCSSNEKLFRLSFQEPD